MSVQSISSKEDQCRKFMEWSEGRYYGNAHRNPIDPAEYELSQKKMEDLGITDEDLSAYLENY